MAIGYYPEECDASGAECQQCVKKTATALKTLTAAPTEEWARGVFHRMYTYAACKQMEHSFLWECETRAATSGDVLVQIGVAAA